MRKLVRAADVAAVLVLSAACCTATAAPAGDRLQATGDAVIDALKRDDLAAVEALFSPRFAKLYPHDQFVATWASIAKDAGPLQECDKPTREPMKELVALDYMCRFERVKMRLRLAINKQNKLDALKNDQVEAIPVAPKSAEAVTAPEPPPSQYPTESATVGAEGWPLPAIFTSPTAAPARAPMVVFVHDAGALDRDELVGANRMFREFADGFAQRGIASLRYDKRSFAHPKRFGTEKPAWTLDDEVIDDAVSAIAAAAARPGAGPVFVVGHGYGGRLAPRIVSVAASKKLSVAGVVLLASSLSPVEDTMVDEFAYVSDLPQSTIKPEAIDDVRLRRDNVKKLITISSDSTPIDPKAQYPANMPVSAWRDLANYDPGTSLLARADLPALLVFGGRDYQTPLKEKRYWQQRLVSRRDTLVLEYPVNHQMMEGRGPITPAEYSRPGLVSEEVVERVATWIKFTARTAR